ncbi:MAG: penicillin acylase family protein [Janthinobacterium lividum]
MRTARLLATGLAGLLLVAAGSVAGVVALTLPPRHLALRVPVLSAPAHVTFDGDGIPRIRAATEADAAAALGVLHARDRLSQMTLLRAVGSGRLAELAGPDAVPLDRMMRTLGLRRLAEADAAAASPEVRGLLEAYASGVNAWTAARGRLASLDAPVLGPPAPWTPADTMLWGRVLALWLSTNERAELSRLALAAHIDMVHVLQLWPARRDALPADAAAPADAAPPPDPRHASLAAGRVLAALPAFPERFTQPAEESDEWAVDGRRSATGAPLLAGDPHLQLGFPDLWYLARIDTPAGTLAGATAPGTPFLVIGRNSHVAWSFTTASIDTQDLFRETVLPDGRYATPDGPAEFARRDETIHVRGAPDVVLHVRETRHGPVVSDLDADPTATFMRGMEPPVLAASMENLRAPAAAAGLLALDRARDVDEAGRAAPLLATPVQNLLVADATRIALFTTGQVPVRVGAGGDPFGAGALPAGGDDGRHDWTGEAGGDALPHFVAPAGGVLLNGNEPTVGPGFPVDLGRDADGDWRARRIRERLTALPHPTVADFAAMQADAGSSFAAALLPVLRAAEIPAGPARAAQDLLQRWDATMAADGPAPLVFNAWVQRFVSDVLARRNVAEAQRGPWEDFAAALLLPPHPGAAYWCAGPCAPVLANSLAEAVAALAPRFGSDPAAWRWGDAHQAVFADALLGTLPVVGRLASRRTAVPGDDTTLFRGGNGTLGRFESRHGAGYRGVYDLSDLDQSRFMIAPGESGHPLSGFAWNMLRRWSEGATIPLGPTPDEVTATVELTP